MTPPICKVITWTAGNIASARLDHQFFAEVYQLQRAGTEDLTALFRRLLPDLRIGGRPNIGKYGNRFAYMSGCKPNEDLFLFAA